MNAHAPKQYAVFGRPIAHSRSPAIHQAFAATLGISLHYRAINVATNLATALAAFRAEGGVGANVTVPFKEEAYALAAVRHPAAALAGASNTLWWDDAGTLHADNTDGVGLLNAIKIHGRLPIAQQSLLILGAGGAVRGVLAPLLQQQPRRLIIANRTLSKAEQLIRHFATLAAATQFQAVSWEACQQANFLENLGMTQPFDLIINATSMGLTPAAHSDPAFALPGTITHAKTLVIDMVYGKETPILAWAKSAHLPQQDGLPMLVEQAASAFALWHGQRPEVAPVLAQLRGSLVDAK